MNGQWSKVSLGSRGVLMAYFNAIVNHRSRLLATVILLANSVIVDAQLVPDLAASTIHDLSIVQTNFNRLMANGQYASDAAKTGRSLRPGTHAQRGDTAPRKLAFLCLPSYQAKWSSSHHASVAFGIASPSACRQSASCSTMRRNDRTSWERDGKCLDG